MKGLIRNNYYAALASAKWLAVAMLVFGVTVIILGKSTPLIIFSLLCVIGFSSNGVASLRKESTSKWNKYKMTTPVRRRDIVKSHFISHLIWILSGTLATSICVGLSILLHGFIFDTGTDIMSIFVAGMSIGFFMGAIFYPLFHLGGEERNEAILGISLVGSIGVFMGLVYLINLAFGLGMQTWQVLLSMAIVLVIAVFTFLLSYLVTVSIFQKKEC